MIATGVTLSVVIPVFNEQDVLPGLLADLQNQDFRDSWEVVVVDGESDDETLACCARWSAGPGIRMRVITSTRGRPQQLNCGARGAEGRVLFFLHADSRLPSQSFLQSAYDRFRLEASNASGPVAGHHGLEFAPVSPRLSSGLYYFAAKSYLNRPEVINGDQGMWIEKTRFRELGGFDESLPYMEDARFARKVFSRGSWITLPGTIVTSPRRFDTQGFRARQGLNAMMRVFDAAGCDAFFGRVVDAYAVQSSAQRVEFSDYFVAAHVALWEGGFAAIRAQLWRLGNAVASQAWQLWYGFDVIAAERSGFAPIEVGTRWLSRYDRFVRRLIESAIGYGCAVVLALTSFYLVWLVSAIAGGGRNRGNRATDHNAKGASVHK